jgi:hypothetical protein
MTCVYLCAFAMSVWVMNDLIDASADRLLMHLVIPALYLISLVHGVTPPQTTAEQLVASSSDRARATMR